jgi:16S rRNA (cytosine967-C5)-methyltransferase
VAFEAMRAVARGGYANLVLPKLLRDWDLFGRDAAFATELTYGATRLRGRYDPVIRQVAGRSQIDPAVMDVLRLGVHQVAAMRVPDHAAVAASVAVARNSIGPGESTFVNAILRAVTEGPYDTLLDQVAPDDGQLEHLAIRRSHPLWVIRALRQAMVAAGRDPDELPQVLDSANQNAPVTLVARPGLITPEQLAEQVKNRTKGETTPGQWANTALIMSRGAPGDLQAIRHGQAAVQDEGSQLVALALAQAQVEDDAGRWLDLCAGPGGKAGLLGAIAAQQGAHLTANEPQEHRAELVRHAVAHVQDHVTVTQEDGRMLDGQFDRVLVDAPCTGLGALRRRPEARWRHSPKDLASLGPLQRELLAVGIDRARPGGVVVYATCSPHVAETRLVVQDVLKARSDAQVEVPPEVLAQTGAADAEGLVQLWTDQQGTDSMFIAVIRKTAG